MRKIIAFFFVIVLALGSKRSMADESHANPFAHIPAEKAVAILVGRSDNADSKLYNAVKITDPVVVSKVAHGIKTAKAVDFRYGSLGVVTVIVIDKDGQPMAAMGYVMPSRPEGFMPFEMTRKGADYFLTGPDHYVSFGIPFKDFGDLVSKYVNIYKIPEYYDK